MAALEPPRPPGKKGRKGKKGKEVVKEKDGEPPTKKAKEGKGKKGKVISSKFSVEFTQPKIIRPNRNQFTFQ